MHTTIIATAKLQMDHTVTKHVYMCAHMFVTSFGKQLANNINFLVSNLATWLPK